MSGEANEEDPLLKKEEELEELEIAPLSTRIFDVLRLYWFLGLIAFGGPSAHVGILRDHLVFQHKYMEDEPFMELFALAGGLPGPTSTQLVIATAVTHAGPIGGILAFVMWVLPAFIVLTSAGIFLYSFINPNNPPAWLLGIPPAAISLIFKAFYAFCLKLDKLGVALAMFSCTIAVMINGDVHIPKTSSQEVYPALLFIGGLCTIIDFNRANPIGTYWRPTEESTGPTAEDIRLSKKIGIPIWGGFAALFIWAAIFIVTTVLVRGFGFTNGYLHVFETTYRIGSIIFGGGIVVLPMLQNVVVPLGWMTTAQFFQGLGLTQSLPGPLFNFSAFVGATYKGFFGAVLAMLGLFGPGFILIFAMMPFWGKVRHIAWFKALLKGLNATAIGLIGSGCVFLYESAVVRAADAMVFIITGGCACYYNVSAPIIILMGALLGTLFSPSILSVGQVKYH